MYYSRAVYVHWLDQNWIKWTYIRLDDTPGVGQADVSFCSKEL